MTSPKLIAFYLPQFHPTKENDIWWGKGFTEWTNVTKATALFDGHYQPHLPADLGFYDLRLKETRQEQYLLAKNHGIYGFCYHYYWFSGQRILNQPVDAMLANEDEDMPFCFCWANENWTRRWDAADHEILIAQKYLEDDDLNFIKSLDQVFRDRRYIRIGGRPLLIVYRPQHLPDSKKSIQIWKDYCKSSGIGDLHVCCALTHGNEDYEAYGFDSGVEFPPHNLKVRHANETLSFHQSFTGLAVQYADIATSYLNRQYPGSSVFKTVFPSWDNTARVGNRAVIMLNGIPTNYEHWLTLTVEQSEARASEFVFINAWNEWAEGCHLEPDRKHGLGFLEATKRVANGTSQRLNFDTAMPSAVKPTFYKDALQTINKRLSWKVASLRQMISSRPYLKKILYPFYRLLSKTKP
jgi:lipopolysaccharide biosynthesis protein